MSKKQLLERIKSLEDYLGVKFIPPDTKDDYAEHVTGRDYGVMGKVEKLINKHKD